MENQKMMLHASLYMIMLGSNSNEAAAIYLDKVAKRHCDLNIPLELYDLWLEKLIETVSEVDEIYNEEIESAWREVLTFGINYMKSKYD